MINQVCICGNVANDPKLMGENSNALRFSLAVNEYIGKDEPLRPSFFDVVLFGKRAETLSEIIRRGMLLTIAGKLRSSTYEKDGVKRYQVEIIANEIQLPPIDRER